MNSTQSTLRLTTIAFVIALSAACNSLVTPSVQPPVAVPSIAPTATEQIEGLTEEQAATLRTLQQVDDYPLYTLQYQCAYAANATVPDTRAEAGSSWGCSLFAALGDPANRLYGRNFDWDYSPALLLFTRPPDGYASVSMVDLAYLIPSTQVRKLTALSLADLKPLLSAPLLPFDGMNEYGLAIGMAAVPTSEGPRDPAKTTIGSLRVIREMLDHARTVDEAVVVMSRYNLEMQGGPPLHYLIADAAGRAVLVEFVQGKTVTIPNENAWHLATNFVRTTAGGDGRGNCPRFDRIYRQLDNNRGQITRPEALGLLKNVSQSSTQWSVVYGQSTGDITVVMGNRQDSPHAFRLQLAVR